MKPLLSRQTLSWSALHADKTYWERVDVERSDIVVAGRRREVEMGLQTFFSLTLHFL